MRVLRTKGELAWVAKVWLLGAVCAAGCGADRGAEPAEPTRVFVPMPEAAPCPSAMAVAPPGARLPPPSAGPAAGALESRSVRCEAVQGALHASFQRSADGTHYAGGGSDNYDTVRFVRCPLSTTSEIRCEGTWEFAHKPALLRVILQADGVVRGELTRSDRGVAVLSCVASMNDLRGG